MAERQTVNDFLAASRSRIERFDRNPRSLPREPAQW
jgi:hypothetical protein